MSEAEAPKRGPGRPRLNPVDAARRNVTLAINSELYDLIKKKADDSGLSLSREMEQSLDKIYTGAAEAEMHRAVSDASEAARNQVSEDIEEEFGGRLTFNFMAIFAEAFNTELRKATVGDRDHAALFLDENRRKNFAAALADHIPGTVKAIATLAALRDLFGGLSSQLEAMKKDDPAGYKVLKGQINQMIAAHKPKKPIV